MELDNLVMHTDLFFFSEIQSPPSRPPPFAPSAVNSQHPFPPRSRSQSRSRCESGTLSSSERQGDTERNCHENCSPGVEDGGEGEEEEVEVEVEIDHEEEEEEDTEDSDSDDSDDRDHSHLDDYVTVIHCNCEDTADRSSDYLRDLWTDLKSS